MSSHFTSKGCVSTGGGVVFRCLGDGKGWLLFFAVWAEMEGFGRGAARLKPSRSFKVPMQCFKIARKVCKKVHVLLFAHVFARGGRAAPTPPPFL